MKSVPSVSKFNSRKEWEEYVWKRIVKGLSKSGSEKENEEMLNMLFTGYERSQAVRRAAAVSMLAQGKTYREIGEALWLSPQTISSLKKSIAAGRIYISHYMRRRRPAETLREKQRNFKPLTKKEWRKIKLRIWVDTLLTIPSPPYVHPLLRGSRPARKRRR